MRLLLLLAVVAIPLPACDRKTPAPPATAQQGSGIAPTTTIAAPPIDPRPIGRVDNSANPPQVRAIPVNPPSNPAPSPTPTGAPTSLDPADAALANSIRQALTADHTLSSAAQRIDLSASRGVIQINGRLASQKELEDLRLAIARITGVRGIDNRVIIGP